jgi:hypothetical protein
MSTSGQPDQLWSKIVEDFREACVLRRTGRHEESNELLQHVLPGEIAAWARAPLPFGMDRRARLETMFKEEQRRVEDAFFVQRLVTSQIEDDLLPKLCFMVAEEVREAVRSDARTAPAPDSNYNNNTRRPTQSPSKPRVRFDDIPAVIDSIIRDQQADDANGFQPA